MARTLNAGFIQLALLVAASFAPFGWGKNTAVAQTNVLTELRQANSELQAGKSTAAISRLDQAINAGKMSQANLARALFLRGRAKQAAGRTAEAIADLNQAIWFGRLSSRQQKEAIALRQKAYQSTGLKAPTSGTTGTSSIQTAAQTPPRVGTTNPPTRSTTHRVAQPIISTGRLPEGQRRTAPAVQRTTAPKVTTWPTQTSATRSIQRRALPSRTLQTPVPKWSQVVTGTVRSSTQKQRKSPRTAPPIKARPTATRTPIAAIPKFRQATVPSPKPKPSIKRTATPKQTWSPLTQQFTPAPQPPKQQVRQALAPKQPQAQPVAPISAATRTPSTAVSPDQTAEVAPPIREAKPITTPTAGQTTLSGIGTFIFGSGTPKSGAITEADRLQAERRARIRAHNKQFGNQ